LRIPAGGDRGKRTNNHQTGGDIKPRKLSPSISKSLVIFKFLPLLSGQTQNKQRWMVYHLLLANTAWCGLNSRLVVLLIPFVLLATAFLLYRDYHRSLAGLCSPELIAGMYFLPAIFLFNLTMWEGLTFDYGIIFVWAVPWFIASFYALEGVLLKGNWRSWVLAAIISGLAVLVFGQSSSFAFGVALAVAFGCRIALNRRKLSKEFYFRSFAAAVLLGIIAFGYLYQLKSNDYLPATTYMDWRVLVYPWDALRFIPAALAGSVLGFNTATSYLSSTSIIILGLLVALIYGWALRLFFKTRMYERTYLPIFMIAYALAFVAFVTMGRFQFGLLYGLASRYTCNTICGIIAIVWIGIYSFINPVVSTKRSKNIVITIAIFLVAGMCWTAAVEWRVQPYRKETFDRLSEIALRFSDATDKELADFEEHPPLIRASLGVLKKYQLNIYRGEVKSPVSCQTLRLSPGSVYITAISSSQDTVRTGHATLEGKTAVGFSATAVLKLVGHYVATGHVAIPASHPTTAARIMIDYRSVALSAERESGLSSFSTGIAITNCSHNAAHVAFTLRNGAGEVLTTGHGILGGGIHFAKFIHQLGEVAQDFKLPAGFSTEIQMGSLDITSDQPLAIAAMRQITAKGSEGIPTTAHASSSSSFHRVPNRDFGE
jgi:hypothetical protein